MNLDTHCKKVETKEGDGNSGVHVYLDFPVTPNYCFSYYSRKFATFSMSSEPFLFSVLGLGLVFFFALFCCGFFKHQKYFRTSPLFVFLALHIVFAFLRKLAAKKALLKPSHKHLAVLPFQTPDSAETAVWQGCAVSAAGALRKGKKCWIKTKYKSWINKILGFVATNHPSKPSANTACTTLWKYQ